MEKKIKYDGQIVPQKQGFVGVILMIDPNKPNHEIVKSHETTNYNEASIWVDDELSRFMTGKGVWD